MEREDKGAAWVAVQPRRQHEQITRRLAESMLWAAELIHAAQVACIVRLISFAASIQSTDWQPAAALLPVLATACASYRMRRLLHTLAATPHVLTSTSSGDIHRELASGPHCLMALLLRPE